MNRSAIRVISLLLSVFMLIPCFSSCGSDSENSGGSSKITDINMFSSGGAVELKVGEKSDKKHITVKAEGDFYSDDIEFISEDEGVARVYYESTTLTKFIYFRIEGIGVGETSVYFKSRNSDVKSESIKVIVRDEDTTQASESTAESVTVADTTEAATTAAAPVETEAPVTAQGSSGILNEDKSGRTVYITPSGTKYHYKQSCAGENAIAAAEDEAAKTREPCKKCVGSASENTAATTPVTDPPAADNSPVTDGNSVTVYITPTGKKYHLSASCAGKNATATTKELAETKYEPCKKCAHG